MSEDQRTKGFVKMLVQYHLKYDGRFSKKQVLEETLRYLNLPYLGLDPDYKHLGGKRWLDYPDEIVVKDYKKDLIPLLQAAFEPHNQEDEINHPETYIAMNTDKRKCAGWALGSSNSELADLYRVIRIQKLMLGAQDEYALTKDKELVKFNIQKPEFRQLVNLFKSLPAPDEDEPND